MKIRCAVSALCRPAVRPSRPRPNCAAAKPARTAAPMCKPRSCFSRRVEEPRSPHPPRRALQKWRWILRASGRGHRQPGAEHPLHHRAAQRRAQVADRGGSGRRRRWAACAITRIAPLSQRLSTLRLALDGNTDAPASSMRCAARGVEVQVRRGVGHRAAALRGGDNPRGQRGQRAQRAPRFRSSSATRASCAPLS